MNIEEQFLRAIRGPINQPKEKSMSLPEIGNLVNIRHTTDYKRNGDPVIVPGDKVVRHVYSVYGSMDNHVHRIKDDCGEVWEVIPNKDDKINAHWMTVPPRFA